MADPARGKNAETVVMINPQAQWNLLLEQLQRDQAAVHAGRDTPLDQVAGPDLREAFVQGFDTRMQCLRLILQLLLERARGLQLLLNRMVGKLRRE
jgi:hypothetical protein